MHHLHLLDLKQKNPFVVYPFEGKSRRLPSLSSSSSSSKKGKRRQESYHQLFHVTQTHLESDTNKMGKQDEKGNVMMMMENTTDMKNWRGKKY